MDSKRIPKSNSDIIWRTLDDGAVLVSPTKGKVRVLNEIGTIIWQMLDGNHTIFDIEQKIVQQYEVPSTQASADVQSFLSELEEKGLLE